MYFGYCMSYIAYLMKFKNLRRWHMGSVLDSDPLYSCEHYFLSPIHAPFVDTKMISA